MVLVSDCTGEQLVYRSDLYHAGKIRFIFESVQMGRLLSVRLVVRVYTWGMGKDLVIKFVSVA